jgi:hypothetical protein
MLLAGSSWAQPIQYQKVRLVENTCTNKQAALASPESVPQETRATALTRPGPAAAVRAASSATQPGRSLGRGESGRRRDTRCPPGTALRLYDNTCIDLAFLSSVSRHE